MRYLFDPIFQSTLSVRRATLQLSGEIRHADISIHALRKESDIDNGGILRCGLDISIHALRKESDGIGGFEHLVPAISIHALRKESDALLI